jgi:hypothetical protein
MLDSDVRRRLSSSSQRGFALRWDWKGSIQYLEDDKVLTYHTHVSILADVSSYMYLEARGLHACEYAYSALRSGVY